MDLTCAFSLYIVSYELITPLKPSGMLQYRHRERVWMWVRVWV